MWRQEFCSNSCKYAGAFGEKVLKKRVVDTLSDVLPYERAWRWLIGRRLFNQVMNPTLQLHASDRVLFFAPHPDDESIGGGGLAQKALLAGAQMRWVFLTNGDRNPWPQRILERRMWIKAKDQRRWGSRRQQEALNALATLGVGQPAEAHFFNWPDQGVTDLLMTGNEEAIGLIEAQIAAWNPTYIISPAAEDTHPDHSAFFVLLRIAIDRLVRRGVVAGSILTYLVHRPRSPLSLAVCSLDLSPLEKATKAEAIQAHETQMLSRKRFLAHAKDQEAFLVPLRAESKHPHHPIVSADQGSGALRLKIQLPKGLTRFGGATVQIALETLLEGGLRWTLSLPSRSAKVPVVNFKTGESRRSASIRIVGRTATILIPIVTAQPIGSIFAKFDRRRVFFDLAGWRELPADIDRGPTVCRHQFGSLAVQ